MYSHLFPFDNKEEATDARKDMRQNFQNEYLEEKKKKKEKEEKDKKQEAIWTGRLDILRSLTEPEHKKHTVHKMDSRHPLDSTSGDDTEDDKPGKTLENQGMPPKGNKKGKCHQKERLNIPCSANMKKKPDIHKT